MPLPKPLDSSPHLTPVVDARILSEEGSWLPNPHFLNNKPVSAYNLPLIFKAKYSVLWPANIHDPLSDQFALVTTI